MSEKRLTGEFDEGDAGSTPPLRSVFRRFGAAEESPEGQQVDEAMPADASLAAPSVAAGEAETIEVPMTNAVRDVLRAKRAGGARIFVGWAAALLVMSVFWVTRGDLSIGLFFFLFAAFPAFGLRQTWTELSADLAEPVFMRTTAVGEISRREGKNSKIYLLDLGPLKLTIAHPERLNKDVRQIVDNAPLTVTLIGPQEVAFKSRLLTADYAKHSRVLLDLRDDAGVVLYRHPEYRPGDALDMVVRS